MTILAVSFAIAMRIERLAARNYADAVRAEHLIQAALAHAMDDVQKNMLSPERRVFPQFSPYRDAFSSSGTAGNCRDLLTGEATNYVPACLFNDAADAASDCKWKYIDFSDSVVSITNGRVAYLVVNCSGLLDANWVGGSNRQSSATVAELDLTGLTDFRGGTEAARSNAVWSFYTNRAQAVRYENLRELARVAGEEAKALKLPVSRFQTYSFDPCRDVYFASTTALGTPGADLRWKFNLNSVTNADLRKPTPDSSYPAKFYTDYLNPLVAILQTAGLERPDDIVWNIVNWIDDDYYPDNKDNDAYLHTEGGEAMPLMNEVVSVIVTNVTTNTVQQPGGRPITIKTTNYVNYLAIELWYPYAGPNCWPTNRQYVLSIEAPANVISNYSVPYMSYTGLQFCVFTQYISSTPAPNLPSEFRMRAFMYLGPLGAFSPSGPLPEGPTSFRKVDCIMNQGYLNNDPSGGRPPRDPQITFNSAIAVSVEDPRSNGRQRYWKPAPPTLGTTNDWSAFGNRTPWGYPRQGLPIYIQNGPMKSIADIGHIFRSNLDDEQPGRPEKWWWNTINLMKKNEGAYLLDRCTVRVTNAPISYAMEGLISINARDENERVLYTLFKNLRVADGTGREETLLPGSNPGGIDFLAQVIASESRNDPFISFQDMFTTDEDGGPVGVAMRQCAAMAWCGNPNPNPDLIPDKVREDVLRHIVDLITFRQNLFTIILAGQALGNDGRTPVAEKRAVALVYRDAYTGRWFTRSFKWLTD